MSPTFPAKNMNAKDAKEAIISWEKKWKRKRDMQRCNSFHGR
jgi:hypothetical protein